MCSKYGWMLDYERDDIMNYCPGNRIFSIFTANVDKILSHIAKSGCCYIDYFHPYYLKIDTAPNESVEKMK